MAFGVTSTGFIPKTLDDCKQLLTLAWQNAFGASIDVTPQSPDGQLIGVLAEREADLWALALAIYNAATADGASGISLDYVAGLTGTVRLSALSSVVVASLTGIPGTLIPGSTTPVGASQVSVTGTGSAFFLQANSTILALAPWAPSTLYAAGLRLTHVGNVYRCTVEGVSGLAGPTGTGNAITDGSCTWAFLGIGTGTVDVLADSINTGPIIASSGTLTVINTPVAGWQGVNNISDATLGRALETDALLRLRREAELRAIGKSPLEAIKAALLQVPTNGVTPAVSSVTVFENVTDAVDSDGRPPHSVEALVLGGADLDVATSIFQNIAAGIRPYGVTVTQSVTDSQGIAHSIQFSRPAAVPIWVIVTGTALRSAFPADGETQIANAIVSWGNGLGAGYSVRSAGVIGQVLDFPGVLDATALIGTAPSPGSGATIPISKRQIATFALVRVNVAITLVDQAD